MILSIPLIHQKHRPDCRHHKSLDGHTGISDVGLDPTAPTSEGNNLVLQNNENLDVEQQIEGNDLCDCCHQNEIINIYDHVQDEEGQSKVHSKCRICCCCCCSPFTELQKLTSHFVASKYFDRIIFAAIILKTLSMAIEYHEQPQSLTNTLEYINFIFITVFALEMLLKIITQGCFKYIESPFNIFDGSIVVISLIELYGTSNSGLSVLRTFRLLRVLKLARFLPTLRRQLVSRVAIEPSMAIIRNHVERIRFYRSLTINVKCYFYI